MKLEIGSNDYFEIRKAQCNAALNDSFTVLYLSDLHLTNRSDKIIVKINERISLLNPDIVLLGGDYIDFKKQLPQLDKLLNNLVFRKNVFAIAGNHDYRFDINIIRQTMEKYGIHWLENSTAIISIKGINIQLDGTRPGRRTDIAHFSILCLHQPIDVSTHSKDYNLVFAGHLHGCQFVFWQRDQGLYPGRLFYKWNMLEHIDGNCHYYVSKGIGDTLPIRINCSKEMIFVQVNGTN